ncbi:MBL fold metallo-hydrolase [uncultured Albimonas sp.]|uniref:MBL fold metallo-hydrolase n=1 Tax=uncultured Albimonas sp. TaxID=1331701 RepID=UPI0030EE58D3
MALSVLDALCRALRPPSPRSAALGLGLALAAAASPAGASVCQSVAGILPEARYVRLAQVAPEEAGEVTIRFVGHSTYLIETGGGVSIATDFNGWAGPVEVPTVVTMNHAHETHWTANPDPRIPHVFRGWPDPGQEKAEIWEEVGDVLVRNVPTDIRGWGGGREPNGNSIFIYEVGQLCIGHLGHLHHTLGPDHYAAIGRLDIVMAAVDGGSTLNLPDMIALLKRVRASVVLPMHYWGYSSLDRFVAGMSDQFRIVNAEAVGELTLTPRTLPAEPTVYILPQGG